MTGSARITLEATGNAQEISFLMRPQRHFWVSLFLCIWLVIAGGAWLFALWELLAGPAALIAFLGLWLAGWTVGCLGALTLLLWLNIGEERLIVTPQAVTVTRSIPIWRRSTRCDGEAVTGLRAGPTESAWPQDAKRSPGLWASRKAGTIKFDYGRYVIGFGLGLETQEARKVVDHVLRHFPQYGPIEDNRAAG
ncbi:hypothetical protein [Sagittula stellata]|uniref:Uncharacterized protein n=1 Tax=Sagittula stellata (strain ATCC 700073 / DSM 11524 / E-37) TaxID=388399 RepID=A3JZ02_SAGS3|nr:hypothetical protein [Sagittula stellata]EBA09705.1 hypothetical protein SSE37_07853 [Sagittula stellata E-37]